MAVHDGGGRPAAPPAAPEGGRGAGKPLVLVVEDDEGTRNALVALLELGGYRTVATALGVEAVRVAPELRPDVVLLDLLLPQSSGLDTLRLLREGKATAAIPVIAMTGLWLDEHPETLASAGFGGALRKPYPAAALFAELERVLAPSAAAGERGAA